jgi:UDP-N-acetylglucosamine 2-epimerase
MLTVVGARPQFVKAAIVSRELRRRDGQTAGEPDDATPPDWPGDDRLEETLVHTGQHYDDNMSDVFFRELRIPEPAHHLGVGSGPSHQQLAAMIERLGPVLDQQRPDVVLVYGDTHSTLAAAVVAAHQDVPLIHVEGGERIYRRRQVPEEVNRILTDHAASLVLTSTRRGLAHLHREAMGTQRASFVGDPMYDLFLWGRQRFAEHATVTPQSLGLTAGEYHLATIHRAENTAEPETLRTLLRAMERARLPVVLPAHPRVAAAMRAIDYQPGEGLRVIEPVGYFDLLSLLLGCQRVLTDSGGVTREAFFAHKPCVIPMDSSWWGEVVEAGWAVEVGRDEKRITAALDEHQPANAPPEGLFGDGDAGGRIVDAAVQLAAAARIGGEAAWHPLGPPDQLPRSTPSKLTHRHYRHLLQQLSHGGYRFAGFPQAQSVLAGGEPFVLLRHDIDLSLDHAVAMARLEADAGAVATYFLMVRGEFYNPFDRGGSEAVRSILRAGHRLGLHFDVAAYPDGLDSAQLAAAVGREVRMLGEWFDTPVEIVSFHRPDARILSGDAAVAAPLPHTYQPLFTRDITYRSDSRGRWAHGHPLKSDAFARRQPLHLLVHPIWWGPQPAAPFQTLQRLLDQRRSRDRVALAANCEPYRVGRLAEAPGTEDT